MNVAWLASFFRLAARCFSLARRHWLWSSRSDYMATNRVLFYLSSLCVCTDWILLHRPMAFMASFIFLPERAGHVSWQVSDGGLPPDTLSHLSMAMCIRKRALGELWLNWPSVLQVAAHHLTLHPNQGAGKKSFKMQASHIPNTCRVLAEMSTGIYYHNPPTCWIPKVVMNFVYISSLCVVLFSFSLTLNII